MKIEKLPSGSYRVRQQYNGKRYTVIFDHKPTQKEVFEALTSKIETVKSVKGTFLEACKEYTRAKENVLSPRTIREYERLPERLPQWFVMLPFNSITQEHIQKCINELTPGHAPKTVRTYNGFISSVIGFYRPNFNIRTTLPQKIKTEPYIPNADDVKTILDLSRNTPYYISLCLACYGLRRSEICALTLQDLSSDNFITINKAYVQSKDGWVIKTTKTADSTRTVPISPKLADEIRKQGFIYNGYPNSISNYLKRTQNKLGMENFSLHKFRHYFASKIMEIDGVTFKDVQALGGWKTDNTVRNVYQHSLNTKTKEGKRAIMDKLTDSLF